MILNPFTGHGSTPARRRFWGAAREAVLSARKVQGRNVTVDEHPGKGTVINVERKRSAPGITCGDARTFTFSGITMDCGCAYSVIGGAYQWEDVSVNGAFTDITGGDDGSNGCYYQEAGFDFGSHIRQKIWEGTDCSGDPAVNFVNTSNQVILADQDSTGLWRVRYYVLGAITYVGIIFKGQGTSFPISNTLSCFDTPFDEDYPFGNYGSSQQLLAVGHGGTITIG